MSREDYSEDDVEHYFNYMGMLATEVLALWLFCFQPLAELRKYDDHRMADRRGPMTG